MIGVFLLFVSFFLVNYQRSSSMLLSLSRTWWKRRLNSKRTSRTEQTPELEWYIAINSPFKHVCYLLNTHRGSNSSLSLSCALWARNPKIRREKKHSFWNINQDHWFHRSSSLLESERESERKVIGIAIEQAGSGWAERPVVQIDWALTSNALATQTKLYHLGCKVKECSNGTFYTCACVRPFGCTSN